MKMFGVSSFDYRVSTTNVQQQKSSLNTPCLGALSRDTLSFSGNSKFKMVDESEPLLEGFKANKMKSIKDLSLEKLVMVHMTNYLPEDGKIKSVKDATLDKNGKSQYRSTVHFALNHPVYDHQVGNWSSVKYAVLVPMSGALEKNDKENFLGGMLKDFFVQGSVNLPEGTVVARLNPALPKGKLKVIDAASEKGFENTKGIKIVESSDKYIKDLASKLVGKMGYSEHDKMLNEACGFSQEYVELMSSPENQAKLMQEDPEKYASITFNIDYSAASKANAECKESWSDFTDTNNFGRYAHTYSPWGRSEHLIEAIKNVTLDEDSWVKHFEGINASDNEEDYDILNDDYDDYDDESEDIESFMQEFGLQMLKHTVAEATGGSFDYQKGFIEVIDDIKENLKPNEKLSYDIDALRNIVEESKTPSIALKRIEDELNLLPMKDSAGEVPDPAAIFNITDSMLGFTEMQKNAMQAIYESLE